jgi:heptaprenyl diphosphate synthase
MNKTRKIVILSLFTAISVIISIIEASLPALSNVPGGKLGICNAIFIILLYKYSIYDAIMVNILRTVVSSLLYGGFNLFIYSFSGAVLSSVIMIVLFLILKDKISPVGLSVAGAFFHNLAQVSVAAVLVNSFYVYSYFSYLSFISIISGTVTGIFAKFYIDFTKGRIL